MILETIPMMIENNIMYVHTNMVVCPPFAMDFVNSSEILILVCFLSLEICGLGIVFGRVRIPTNMADDIWITNKIRPMYVL